MLNETQELLLQLLTNALPPDWSVSSSTHSPSGNMSIVHVSHKRSSRILAVELFFLNDGKQLHFGVNYNMISYETLTLSDPSVDVLARLKEHLSRRLSEASELWGT